LGNAEIISQLADELANGPPIKANIVKQDIRVFDLSK
jgi:hypothetical protein